MHSRARRGGTVLLALTVVLLPVRPAVRTAASAATASATTASNGATASAVVALPGYQVSVFAQGTATYSNPDSLTSDGTHVYVGYQNIAAKEGHSDAPAHG